MIKRQANGGKTGIVNLPGKQTYFVQQNLGKFG